MSSSPAEKMKDQKSGKQPNSRSCFVCGVDNPYGLKLDFYETNPGRVVVDTVIPDHYQGYPSIVHGGIVACLVDEALGRAQMGNDVDNPRFMYTAKLSVEYRKPVPTNMPIRIVGVAVKTKNRFATSKAEIYGPNGDLLVSAEALLVNVPEKVINSIDLDALGWRIYQDAEVTNDH